MINLKNIRLLRNKSQKTAAQDLGIGLSTFSQYETGKREPDNKTLVKLADYFNCSVDYLLGRVDDPNDIKKTVPSEDDTVEYVMPKDMPELTPDEVKELKDFLRQRRS